MVHPGDSDRRRDSGPFDRAGEVDLSAFQWVELYTDWNKGIERIISVIEPLVVTRPTSFTNPTDGSARELVPGGTYGRQRETRGIDNRGVFGDISIGGFYMSLHYCPAISLSGSADWKKEVVGVEGWDRGRPVKWALSRKG